MCFLRFQRSNKNRRERERDCIVCREAGYTRYFGDCNVVIEGGSGLDPKGLKKGEKWH